MANYTTRVYDVLRYYNNNDAVGGGKSALDAINNHWNDIFDIDIWSTYDANYKPTLCKKILRHYLMYEIGSETVELWKIELNSKLSEIMDKYNVMYANIDKAYTNFFNDVDYTETTNHSTNETNESTGTTSGQSNETTNGKADTTQTANASGESVNSGESSSIGTATSSGTTTATNTGASTNNTDGWQASSDTPQGALTGLENNNYLSSAVHNYGKGNSTTNTNADSTSNTENDSTTKATSKDSTTTTNTSESVTSATTNQTNEITNNTNTSDSNTRNLTENYVKNVIGKMGSQNNAQLYNDIVKRITNIDEMIINELKECFLLIWE